jgi:DNA-binding beta-propeller fold protein YncE
VLRRIPLPVDAENPGDEIALPGPPAQVLPLTHGVLVTVRDPGLVLVLRELETGVLVEDARIAVPPDAWGLAVSADERFAVVSSAYASKISTIDLTRRELVTTIDVAREPRGISITRAGTAYVSHLMGTALTRLDDVASPAPLVSRVDLPASPMRAPVGHPLSATLGYAPVLSPDDSRLFVPRHAIGALGSRNWYGAPTVDVLVTANDAPLAETRRPGGFTARITDYDLRDMEATHGVIPFVVSTGLTQPRAAVYRERTRTLLVASEGDDSITELDVDAIDPTLARVRTYSVGSRGDWNTSIHHFCSAPKGIALSADETTAYVYCGASFDLAILSLSDNRPGDPIRGEVAGLQLAEDPLGDEGAFGRRTFHTAWEGSLSGGLACAGCHPEGRDDGQTWHEAVGPMTGSPIFLGVAENMATHEKKPAGVARQTPMLAGRVDAEGPYGWHAESKTLEDRLRGGLNIHRWDGMGPQEEQQKDQIRSLAVFLRKGLVTPARERHAPTAEEERGRELFAREDVGCATCHDPATAFTTRVAYPLRDLPTRPGFTADPHDDFKTPSLLFVGGTAPYFHDGSAGTLEELVERNGNRMGNTGHLPRADRAALVAFLKIL